MAKGKDLKKVLKKKGLWQYELADVVGISEYTLCKWLRDENEIPERKEKLLRKGIEKLEKKYLTN